MNRRQKIIVSVVGIFIVLLALVGLTYAYFLTQITGNNEDTSITVTTANLELVYGDGNGVLTPAETIVPGNAIKFKKTDGTIVNEKTFTVTNTGDDTDYVVIIEGDNNLENGLTPINVTYATNSGTEVAGAKTTFESNDFRYTLTCTNGTEECNGVTNEVFPLNGGIAVGNKISSNEVHTYTLTMEYIETDINQSEDMNKTFSAVLNIEDIRRINPYSEGTFAYNIVNNSVLNTNGTKLLSAPIQEENLEKDGTAYKVEFPLSYIYSYGDTKEEAENCSRDDSCFVLGSAKTCSTFINKYVVDGDTGSTFYINGCNGEVPYYNIYLEKTMTVTQDDYGKSYYYRGPVEDNYVNFADMCWRIVRINGDGSIKLILEDQYATCDDKETQKTAATYTGNWNIGSGSYNYSSYGIGKLTYSDGTTNTDSVVLPDYLHGTSGGMREAFKTFQSNFTSEELDKMKSGGWCLNDTKSYSRSGASAPYTYTLMTETERIDSHTYDGKGQTVYYDSFVRLFGESSEGVNQTLKCQGTVINDFADDEENPTPMYVSTLVLDELMYAGIDNTNMKKYNYLTDNNYNTTDWLPLNIANNGGDPSMIFAYSYNNYGLSSRDSLGRGNFRPAINLASKTTFKDGNGTIEDPYEVE